MRNLPFMLWMTLFFILPSVEYISGYTAYANIRYSHDTLVLSALIQLATFLFVAIFLYEPKDQQ